MDGDVFNNVIGNPNSHPNAPAETTHFTRYLPLCFPVISFP